MQNDNRLYPKPKKIGICFRSMPHAPSSLLHLYDAILVMDVGDYKKNNVIVAFAPLNI